MKRAKRTVYLLPDLSKRVDETAALGGESPNAIIEAALGDYFARESIFGAVETQTRRLGEVDERVKALDERVKAQNATLAKMGESINSLGRLVMDLKGAIEHTPSRPPDPVEHEPVRNGLLGGWRR